MDLSSVDWKFLIGDIGVPVLLFFLGIFTGRTIEKRVSNKAKIKGDGNTVIQGSDIKK